MNSAHLTPEAVAAITSADRDEALRSFEARQRGPELTGVVLVAAGVAAVIGVLLKR